MACYVLLQCLIHCDIIKFNFFDLYQGAMYMMVRIDMSRFPAFKNDLHFVESLVSEQSVFCLPGKCFNYPNYFRIVLTLPENLLSEACDRMLEFCSANLVCPPPSRLVGLLVDNRSLYATYGKKYGMFLDDPHSSHWHQTWQLAVSLSDSIRNGQDRERKESWG